MNLTQTTFQFIKRHHLIRPKQTILLGVSGGIDSMVMLYVLVQLRSQLGCHFHVIHIHHGLRCQADRDARLVTETAKTLHLPYTVIHLNLQKKIREGGSIEELAREARLDTFESCAKKLGANAIALAHHRDDLAETVLMRILRGTGLQGMQAILPKRQLQNLLVIRPLLDVQRQDIENFAKAHEIKYFTDHTNQKTIFFRNKIRLELLPLLKSEYQNQITQCLCNLATTVGEDYDLLRSQALKLFPRLISKKKKQQSLALKTTPWLKLHPSLQRMIIRLSLENLKGDARAITLTHLIEIDDLIYQRPVNSIVHLPSGISVKKEARQIILSH